MTVDLNGLIVLLRKAGVSLAIAALCGCSTMLPKSETATQAPWRSFDEASRMFDAIAPGETTVAQLKAMGIDPFAEDNITILNYADLIRRFAAPGTNSLADLDHGLAHCIAAKLACRGYEIEQREIHRDHVGNFWMEFLNFNRVVRSSGWRFSATIVILDDQVVYKIWSGQPSIREVEDSRNPLGPFQTLGISSIPFR